MDEKEQIEYLFNYMRSILPPSEMELLNKLRNDAEKYRAELTKFITTK